MAQNKFQFVELNRRLILQIRKSSATAGLFAFMLSRPRSFVAPPHAVILERSKPKVCSEESRGATTLEDDTGEVVQFVKTLPSSLLFAVFMV